LKQYFERVELGVDLGGGQFTVPKSDFVQGSIAGAADGTVLRIPVAQIHVRAVAHDSIAAQADGS